MAVLERIECFIPCAIHESLTHGVVDEAQIPMFPIKTASPVACRLFPLLFGAAV